MDNQIRLRKFSHAEQQILHSKASHGVLGAKIILYAAEMIKQNDFIDYQKLATELYCDDSTVLRNIRKFNEFGCFALRNSGRPKRKRKLKAAS